MKLEKDNFTIELIDGKAVIDCTWDYIHSAGTETTTISIEGNLGGKQLANRYFTRE